jgi:hypothetical protein
MKVVASAIWPKNASGLSVSRRQIHGNAAKSRVSPGACSDAAFRRVSSELIRIPACVTSTFVSHTREVRFLNSQIVERECYSPSVESAAIVTASTGNDGNA